MERDDRGRGPLPTDRDDRDGQTRQPACPACGGRLVEVKGKLRCSRCRLICETCCEGGPG